MYSRMNYLRSHSKAKSIERETERENRENREKPPSLEISLRFRIKKDPLQR